MNLEDVKRPFDMEAFLAEKLSASTDAHPGVFLELDIDWQLQVVRLDPDEGGFYAYRYVHTVHSRDKTSSQDSYGEWRTGWAHTMWQFVDALKHTVIKAGKK